MGLFHKSPEEQAVRRNREESRRAIIEGQKAVRRGDFSAAEAARQRAVAHEVVAQRYERLRDIKKSGTLYQPTAQTANPKLREYSAHVRRAERTR